jgi:hypothetical protein
LHATIGLAAVLAFILFSPNVSPTANQKPKISTKDEQRIFSPALQPNSEQKVDEMHFSPS